MSDPARTLAAAPLLLAVTTLLSVLVADVRAASIPVRADQAAVVARRALDPRGGALAPAALDPPVTSADGDGAWRDFVPPARRNASAEFDPVGDRLLLIGGVEQLLSDETWSFDAAADVWTRLAPGGRIPAARAQPGLVYDPARHRLWMYGGLGGNGSLSGLWSFDLAGEGTWTLLEPLGTWPDACGAGSLVLDPARDRLLLYGGELSYSTTGSGATGEVWAIAPAADTLRWVRLAPSGPRPPARWGAITVFDAARDRLVVLGGRDRDSVFTDAWELRFSPSLAWAPLTTAGPRPPAREGALGALDPAGGRIVTVGGVDPATGRTSPDVWTFDLAGPPAWSPLPASGTLPTDLANACAAFDPARRRLLIHGGGASPQSSPSYVSNQTWALELAGAPAWRRLAPAYEMPSPRFGMARVTDPGGGGFWTFGGLTGRDGRLWFADDLWRADLGGTEHWTRIVPAGPAPEGRHEPVGAYDPIARRLFFFGGWNIDPQSGTYHYLDDTWSVNVDPPCVWTRLPGPETGAVAPAGRRADVGIYDPLRGSLIVHGGVDADSAFDDVWELPLAAGGVWRKLAPEGDGPGPRYLAGAVYDAPRDRMVVFGGTMGGQSQGDAWALSLGASPRWTRLTPGGSGPGPRSYYGTTYDDARHRMLVWGGYDIDYDVIFSTYGVWALSLDGDPHWAYVRQTGVQPGPLTGPAVACDAPRDRMVTFGGTEVLGDYSGEFRALEFASGAPARPAWLLGAGVEGNAARLVWGTSTADAPQPVRVYKRIEVAPEGFLAHLEQRPGDWYLAADLESDAQGLVAWTDNEVHKGGSYGYRLEVSGRTGGEASVGVPGTPRLAIERVAPVPTAGDFTIWFRSSGLAPIAVTLYDVRGRRVDGQSLGSVPEGPASASLSVPTAPPGVYFLQLAQGVAVETRKLVVVR